MEIYLSKKRFARKINNLTDFLFNIIKKLSDCNWTQTQNHLVLKQTLNHLAQLQKEKR